MSFKWRLRFKSKIMKKEFTKILVQINIFFVSEFIIFNWIAQLLKQSLPWSKVMFWHKVLYMAYLQLESYIDYIGQNWGLQIELIIITLQ